MPQGRTQEKIFMGGGGASKIIASAKDEVPYGLHGSIARF